MASASSPSQGKSTMQLAEILSDLTSLRVCDPTAALALVSARPLKSNSGQAKPESKDRNGAGEDEEDGDLKRAKELVELHYTVREASKKAELVRGLERAREAVWRAVG